MQLRRIRGHRLAAIFIRIRKPAHDHVGTVKAGGEKVAEGIRPIRRVVTGNDAQGRSRVLFDSAAPRTKSSPFQKGTNMTDIWTFAREIGSRDPNWRLVATETAH